MFDQYDYQQYGVAVVVPKYDKLNKPMQALKAAYKGKK